MHELAITQVEAPPQGYDQSVPITDLLRKHGSHLAQKFEGKEAAGIKSARNYHVIHCQKLPLVPQD